MSSGGNFKNIIKDVDQYYSGKVLEHGATPRGVDWNGKESQEVRFVQLSRIIDPNEPFTVLDYGCGFGAMYDFFNDRHDRFDFYGFDISQEMLKKAQELYGDKANFHLIISEEELEGKKFDYVVASGIFNVRLNNQDDAWLEYIRAEVAKLDTLSTKGFSFNMLTKYSDPEYCRDYLFYGDPGYWFDVCKRSFSRNVALLHDYELYEFTIIVRK